MKEKPLPDSLETIEQMLVSINGSLIDAAPSNAFEQIVEDYEKVLEILQVQDNMKNKQSVE